MPNEAAKLDRRSTVETGHAPSLPASLDCNLTLRQLISEAIAASTKSREQIADEMSYLIGSARITTPMLNCYTAESKEQHRFPLAFLPAFCQVTGDLRPLECVARLVGVAVLSPEQLRLAELGARVIDGEAITHEVEALKQLLRAGRDAASPQKGKP